MIKLEDIKGVGKVTLAKLNEIGIFKSEDLLFVFPKKYEIHAINSYSDVDLDKNLTLEVTVFTKPKVFFIRKKLTKLSFEVSCEDHKFVVSIFNREYLSNVINPGVQLVITGKFLKNYSSFSANNLALKDNYVEGIVPQYNLPDINDNRIKKIIFQILSSGIKLKDQLPAYLLAKNNFISINEIIDKIHLPKTTEDIQEAKKRLAYEEFLNFALRVESINKINQRIVSPKKNYDIVRVKELIARLPFELTDDQKQVTNEIFRDFKKDSRMNRLLLGDVGSGKTVIALLSSFAVVTANYQVVLIAPTLVLAKQHYQTFTEILNQFSVKICLLTSETSSPERIRIYKEIKEGGYQIIIGTHSLLQDDITFKDLGYVVIDEQQRFGVEQRKRIRQKGINPDVLIMSATPIPRTLAISMFGNTDVSIIKTKPRNRQLIKTRIIDFESLPSIFPKIENELKQNRQIYVICPLIESSDSRTYISVEEAFNLFSKALKATKIDILHGKMSDQEKNIVLEKFYNNSTQVLISTTVVEVGVNVENATMMIVMNANAYGLAQLHQLRGRVGRNDYSAHCYLVVDDLVENLERLEILQNSNDGFAISEFDLSMRGPGEVFGKTQSGVPNFQFANLVTDISLGDLAFNDAKEILLQDDDLSRQLVIKAIKSIDSYNLD